MYEIIIENNQIENMEKYNVGTPKTAPSKLKTSMNGMLKIKNNAIDNTISFCSWRFFIWLVVFISAKAKKNNNALI